MIEIDIQIVSLPSSLEAISYNKPIILFNLLLYNFSVEEELDCIDIDDITGFI